MTYDYNAAIYQGLIRPPVQQCRYALLLPDGQWELGDTPAWRLCRPLTNDLGTIVEIKTFVPDPAKPGTIRLCVRGGTEGAWWETTLESDVSELFFWITVGRLVEQYVQAWTVYRRIWPALTEAAV